MYPENYKVDIIIPTTDINKWPANESIKWNKYKANINKNRNVIFCPIQSSGENFSFSGSINMGLYLSGIGDSESDKFLLNDDCFMDSFWIEKLLSAKISHPECGIFGALLRYPSEKEPFHGLNDFFSGQRALSHWKPEYQHAGGYIPLNLKDQLYGIMRFGFWNLSPLFVLRQVVKNPEMGFRFPGHYNNLKQSNKIHLITAAAMLITNDAFKKLGYFDWSLPLSFNDTDYSLRALEEGIGLCLVSDCTGVHYESLTTKHLENKKRKDYQRFYKIWSEERIKSVIKDNNKAIVHPKFCGCGDWIE